ncbi:hypothetical protein GXP67_00880 [Rhodocytophaga rosea]|uniref:Uncharacterized protein n=1 Tax=Rhodocytophaga rosea TaxID=2704465 RepID=A0A6C0GBQ8_9BACT|nr:hypothetical protein [Rhodocytophaga rosea]QHT65327.1 hypothetical protein GXP67_00880 [Rhodocytophaga rosea]
MGQDPLVIDFYPYAADTSINSSSVNNSIFDIDMVDERLSEWAESVLKQAELTFVEQIELLHRIKGMIQSPQSGWQKVCSTEGLFLVIINPPFYKQVHWFWEAINTCPGTIWLFTNQTISNILTDTWQMDTLLNQYEQQNVLQAWIDERRLMNIMATLDMEIPEYLLVNQGWHQFKDTDFMKWQYAPYCLIKTDAGILLSAFARYTVFSQPSLSEHERQQAHKECFYLMLKQAEETQTTLKEIIVEKMFFHAVQAKMEEQAIDFLNNLIKRNYNKNRPKKIIELIKLLNSNKALSVSNLSKLYVAWAYLQLFELRRAEFWLNHCIETSVDLNEFDKAMKFILQAEIIKAKGEDDDLRSAIDESLDQAIKILEPLTQSTTDSTVKSRALREIRKLQHDKLRIIQYIFHGYPEAKQGYRSLLKEWVAEGDEYGSSDRAIIRRNLAECIYQPVKDKIEREEPLVDLEFLFSQLEEAQRELMLANEEVASDQDSTFPAEILYVLSKIVECKALLSSLAKKGNSDEFRLEARRILEDCIQKADLLNNFMLLGVARSRKFWKFEDFEPQRLLEINKILEAYTHGWAIRTRLNNLVGGAARLLEQNKPEDSLQWLCNAAKLTLQHSYLNKAESDQSRIKKILGLHQVLVSKTVNNDCDKLFNQMRQAFG